MQTLQNAKFIIRKSGEFRVYIDEKLSFIIAAELITEIMAR